jgi:excinuclease ABC subunit C
VGDGRRRTLLKHFGSVKRVREASIDDIAEAVGPAVAERVHAWLHGKADGTDEVRTASLEDAGSPVAE